jgi:hypothetical protein
VDRTSVRADTLTRPSRRNFFFTLHPHGRSFIARGRGKNPSVGKTASTG